MAGETTTGSLADSLNTIVAAARVTREYEGAMPQLVDKVTLGVGVGLDWKEIALAQLVATAVGEKTVFDNPQQITDSAITITPTVVGIHTVITDRTKARISSMVFGKIGQLGQNAIQRKKDEDGLVMLDGATTSLCGAGFALASGHITAAEGRITGNTTEPGAEPIVCVLHPYQIQDLKSELLAPLGVASLDGLTARVYTEGKIGTVGGVTVFRDGNISIDSASDAKGGVFAKMGIILVQGRAPWAFPQRNNKLGGGADEYLLYDEYAYGERSAGNWLYELYSDATVPTS